jgi:NAD(P)-dependent dehydrogenase (short-subunit alcohol dehydrogenase family)
MVIGATGGIGSAIARALAPAYDLTLVGRDAAVLGRLRAEIGAARALAADVTVELEVAALADDLPDVDVLVYAVGAAVPGALGEADVAAWEAQWGANVWGFALALKHLGPRLAKGGRVLVLGARPELSAARGMAAYAASKAAVDGLARVAALELRRGRVSVTVVRPGAVDTGLWAPLGGAPKGAMDAHDVAARVVEALRSDAQPELLIGADSG